MSIKKYWRETRFPLFAFISWRIALFIILLLSANLIPLQKNFLGGGMQNYLRAPWFYAWANYDGEHYISIAQRGYANGEQAFFPLFPLLINPIAKLLNGNIEGFILSGLIISNLSFILALIGLYKLVKLDFKEKVAKLTILLLLLFPTSFYFARKQKWLYAGILGMLASSTRVIGIILFPVLILELLNQRKNKLSIQKFGNLLPLFLVPLGLMLYMFYLKQTVNDPLAFIHTLSGFGEQRSSTLILLPQVFYRYIFKILPNLNYSYFPVVFSTLMEFIIAVVFMLISVLTFFRQRLSYSLFLLLGFLIPTFSGSFSSLPRYVLVLFPGFILFAQLLANKNKILQCSLFGLLFICLGIAFSLFVRGFWIA